MGNLLPDYEIVIDDCIIYNELQTNLLEHSRNIPTEEHVYIGTPFVPNLQLSFSQVILKFHLQLNPRVIVILICINVLFL